MEEIWKDIKGYEGLYKVSNFGKIKSIPRKGTYGYEHILVQRNNDCGYPMVNLSKNGKGRTIAVHRIVAKNFIDNLQNKREVNHIDGNKENNRTDNLEWVSHYENMEHARKNNLISVSKKVIEQGKKVGKKYGSINGKKRAKKVTQLDKNNEVIREWNSITEIYKETGISISGISKCCNGKKKYAGGYKWEFIN